MSKLFLATIFIFIVGNMAKAGEIKIYGDSVFAKSGAIAEEFQRISNHSVISHAVNGAVMSDIRDQYHGNKHENITTVIMDGGGNDVLQRSALDCLTINSRCIEAVDNALGVMEQTLEEMAEDGLRTVVWVGYYRPIFIARGLRGAVDYAVPFMKDVCEKASIECIMIDPREVFKDRWLVTYDGIHPTRKGSRLLAEMIWETFKDHGIEP